MRNVLIVFIFYNVGLRQNSVNLPYQTIRQMPYKRTSQPKQIFDWEVKKPLKKLI
jgi:hypothetical protein